MPSINAAIGVFVLFKLLTKKLINILCNYWLVTKVALQRPVTVCKKKIGSYVSFIDFVHYGCFQQNNILSEGVKWRKKHTNNSKISFFLSALEYLHSPLCLFNSLCMNSKKWCSKLSSKLLIRLNIWDHYKSRLMKKVFLFIKSYEALKGAMTAASEHYCHWKCHIKMLHAYLSKMKKK